MTAYVIPQEVMAASLGISLEVSGEVRVFLRRRQRVSWCPSGGYRTGPSIHQAVARAMPSTPLKGPSSPSCSLSHTPNTFLSGRILPHSL